MSPQPRRILVVDDHPVNLKLACDVMEHEGYLVERAASVAFATSALSAPQGDLILPALNARAIFSKLRSTASGWLV